MDLEAILDRVSYMFWGAFVVLLLLDQTGRGEFSREAAIALLLVLPAIGARLAARWWNDRDAFEDARASLGPWSVVAKMAFVTCIALFAAKHIFEVKAIGQGMFVPLAVYVIASWLADRE